MTEAAARRRPPINLTLSEDAQETLTRFGGPRGRAAVVEALLAALAAGEVPSFAARLAAAQGARSEEAAERARALPPKNRPRPQNKLDRLCAQSYSPPMTTTGTKRERVAAVLRARGLVEEAPGDWRGAGAYVRLDIAHSPPETAWFSAIYNGAEMPREVLTYDEVIARFE
jgi:hypothetical protein